jgi:hypothetical protein
MILFDTIIQIRTLPDPDRLQFASRWILELAFRIAGQNGLPVGLAAVDDDPLRSAVPLECLAQKALGRSQIAPLAEPNSTVSPLLPMARYTYIHRPRTLM